MDMQPFSPSIMSYPDPGPEFDYTAFLQPEHGVTFQSPASHNPVPSSLSESSGKNTPPSSDSVGSRAVVRRPTSQRERLERRGHTKSRRGCFNCKRRRIKCQETHPACGHCVKTGLKCEYPSTPSINHQPHHQVPLFSLQDMRFFQHFLTQCYPHHPLKQEETWTHDIPCIAHNHEFLMHAILGFAASELIPTDQSLVTAAMSHRVRAIRAIKKRLAEADKISTTYEEANALVATCFVLTFQSVSLQDGLAEYMTFIRGIVIVGMQMMFKGIKPIFSNMFEQEQDSLLQPYMEGLPLIQRGWVDAAMESILALRPLCIEPVEIGYYDRLLHVVQTLYTDSFEAYKANSKQYSWWMLLPHSTFQQMLNLDNQIMVLLHTHWISLSQIMVFITEREYEVRVKHPSQTEQSIDPGFIRWLKYLNLHIDNLHQPYNRWPAWVDQQLEMDISFFGKRK